MEHGPIQLAFEYSDLPDASTHIRLLEVQHARVGGPISCRLSTWEVSKALTYTAISYTWGDPADTTEIDINGAQMTVRGNCAYVLCQASWHGPGHYWVDSICINQSDDSEKSHQVRMMGNIYRAAHAVLACVGALSLDDESEFLCRFIRKHETALCWFADQLRPYPEDGYQWPTSTRDRRRRLLRSITWRLRHSRKTHSRAWVALRRMIGRPYFTRVWVAQELYMAKSPLLYCGPYAFKVTALEGLLAGSIRDDTTPGGDLPVRQENLFLVKRWLPCCMRILGPVVGVSDPDDYTVVGNLSSSIARFAGRNSAKPQSLQSMMFSMRDLHCTDARDRVYATLSTLSADVAQRIHVDYTKTSFELATHMMPLLDNQPVKHARGLPRVTLFGVEQLLDSFRSLEIQLSDPAFQAALAARSEALSFQRPLQTDTIGHQANLRSYGWIGCQIQHTDKGWSWQPPDCLVDASLALSSRDTALVHLQNSQGTIAATVPNIVRCGDWLITPHLSHWPEPPGLLLRHTLGKRYEILSAARIRKNFAALREAEFELFVEPQDLSTMLCHYLHYRGTTSSEVQHPLVQAPCDGAPETEMFHSGDLQPRREGTSVAYPVLNEAARSQHPNVEAEEARSPLDLGKGGVERYTHVRFCRLPGSSYATKKIYRGPYSDAPDHWVDEPSHGPDLPQA